MACMAVRAVLNDAGQGHAEVLVCLQILNEILLSLAWHAKNLPGDA